MKFILSGGLGSQMFQHVFYLALKDKGRNVKLDLSLYSCLKMHIGCELEKLFLKAGLDCKKRKTQ